MAETADMLWMEPGSIYQVEVVQGEHPMVVVRGKLNIEHLHALSALAACVSKRSETDMLVGARVARLLRATIAIGTAESLDHHVAALAAPED